jgi:hypothetical protein
MMTTIKRLSLTWLTLRHAPHYDGHGLHGNPIQMVQEILHSRCLRGCSHGGAACLGNATLRPVPSARDGGI